MSEVVNVGGDYYISDIYYCGMLFSWVMSVCPSGTGLGNEHFLRHVFVLDIYYQQLWNVVQLGTGLENVHSTVLGGECGGW